MHTNVECNGTTSKVQPNESNDVTYLYIWQGEGTSELYYGGMIKLRLLYSDN